MADSSGTATIIGASIAEVVALVGLVASKEQKTSEFPAAGTHVVSAYFQPDGGFDVAMSTPVIVAVQ